jgi:hypothetical protein
MLRCYGVRLWSVKVPRARQEIVPTNLRRRAETRKPISTSSTVVPLTEVHSRPYLGLDNSKRSWSTPREGGVYRLGTRSQLYPLDETEPPILRRAVTLGSEDLNAQVVDGGHPGAALSDCSDRDSQHSSESGGCRRRSAGSANALDDGRGRSSSPPDSVDGRSGSSSAHSLDTVSEDLP